MSIKKAVFILTLLWAPIAFSSCLQTTSPLEEETKTSIEGFVADKNGNRLHDALVYTEINSEYAKTDKRGYYKISQLTGGIHTFIASSPLFLPRKVTLDIDKNGFQKGINFVLDPQSHLIKDVSAKIESSRSIKITWATKFAGDTQVEFGTDLSYGFLSERDITPKYNHSVILENLSPGSKYFYRVRSYDKRGYLFYQQGDPQIVYEFELDPGKPEPPLRVSISPQALQGEVMIEWTSNPHNLDIIGYDVFRSISKNGPFTKINSYSIPPDFSSYRDQALSIAQKYYYYVVANDGEGLQSNYDNLVTVTVPGKLEGAQIWLKSENPYILNGDLYLLPGSLLQAEEGVIIALGEDNRNILVDGNKVEIRADGQLVFSGIESSPVTISGVLGLKDEWLNITIEPSSSNSSFKHCIFSGSSRAALEIKNNLTTVQDCQFNFAQGGILVNQISDFTVKGLTFSAVDRALVVNQAHNISVINNTFENNIQSINCTEVASLSIKLNEIRNSSGGAIMVSHLREHSIIHHNLIAPLTGTGIETILASSTIYHNTIDTTGTAIVLGQGHSLLENNLIVSTGNIGITGIMNSQSIATATYNSIINYSTDYVNVTGLNTPGLTDVDFVGGEPFSYQIKPGDPHLNAGRDGVQLGRYGGIE